MRIKIIFITILSMSLCFQGCKQPNRQIKNSLKEFIGTEIVIPEGLVLFNDTNDLIRKEAKYKAIFYIDSLSCTSCHLNQSTTTWSNMLKTFKDVDFSLFVIFQSQDIEGIQSLFESYGLDIPFFMDFGGDIESRNKLPAEKILHTFLLEDGKVILAGSPYNNPKLFELYKRRIFGH